MWEGVANAVMSYTLVSNLTNVSEEYGTRTLLGAAEQAIEVERISDDPPERVQAWVTTVTESALAQLDLEMVLDLLRIEGAAAEWEPLSVIAAAEAERRTLTGDVAGATCPARGAGARDEDGWAAGAASRRDASGRSSGWRPNRPARRDALPHRHRFGSRSLQSAVSVARPECRAGRWPTRSPEKRTPSPFDGSRALLLSFGAAGRRSVEQLKNSPNPAVRRTAITLLRRAGGQEALLELASMLGDARPGGSARVDPRDRRDRDGQRLFQSSTDCCSKPTRRATARCASCSASATTRRCHFSATCSPRVSRKESSLASTSR